MKITKRQLRRIIREEKARLLNEQKPSEMSMHDAGEYYRMKASGKETPGEKGMKNQFAAKKLQTVYKNLMDMQANARGPMYDELNNQLVLLEDAMDLMGISR